MGITFRNLRRREAELAAKREEKSAPVPEKPVKKATKKEGEK